MLEWQQYTADALVTLARQAGSDDSGARRSPTTLIVHLSDDAAAAARRRRADQPRDSRATRMRRTPPHHQAQGRDLVHSRVGRCASYAQQRALHKRSGGHCQYPGCTAARELEAHHLTPAEYGGRTELDNLILLCPRHHKHLHDHHIHTNGTADHPAFADQPDAPSPPTSHTHHPADR